MTVWYNLNIKYTVYINIIYGGFLKWWYPTTMGFPTTNDHFGVFWGYHHLRKHPYRKNEGFGHLLNLIGSHCWLNQPPTQHSLVQDSRLGARGPGKCMEMPLGWYPCWFKRSWKYLENYRNMEHNNGCLEDDFPFKKNLWFFRFHVHFQGCIVCWWKKSFTACEKLRINWHSWLETGPRLKMHFLWKMRMFHCHVRRGYIWNRMNEQWDILYGWPLC